MDNNINENAVVNQPAEPTLTEAPEYAQPTYTQPDLAESAAAAEPVVEAAAEAVAAEPVVEAAPAVEPIVEPVAAPAAEPVVEPVAAPAPQPVAQPVPAPVIPTYTQPTYTQPQQPTYTQPTYTQPQQTTYTQPQQQPVYAQQTAYTQPVVDSKSKIAAGILGILLGAFGVHNFYLGYTGKAIAQLLITLCSCGIFAFVSAVWGLIEGIMILAGSINTDANGNLLSE